MRIAYLSTSSGDTHNIISSLYTIGGENEIKVVRYDQRWHEALAQAVQSNPQVRDVVHAGGFKSLGWPRERVAMDAQIIKEMEDFRPDIILQSSAFEGYFCLLNETLTKLNSIAPFVHVCHDASDFPWWGLMEGYERDNCYSLTLNIDGGKVWPGGDHWPYYGFDTAATKHERGPIIKGLTLLTPVDPRPYLMNQKQRVSERFYPIGYAGNTGGPIRGLMVQQLIRHIPEILVRQRQETPNSYMEYASFLSNCRLTINVPFTGSNSAKHVKGRVVEAGYAGTCLMEWHNPATEEWFIPRHEYVSYGKEMQIYEGVQDAIDQAKFLIARPKLCEDIAMALQARVLREHSPQVFWSKVFGAVGLPKEAEKTAEAAD